MRKTIWKPRKTTNYCIDYFPSAMYCLLFSFAKVISSESAQRATPSLIFSEKAYAYCLRESNFLIVKLFKLSHPFSDTVAVNSGAIIFTSPLYSYTFQVQSCPCTPLSVGLNAYS